MSYSFEVEEEERLYQMVRDFIESSESSSSSSSPVIGSTTTSSNSCLSLSKNNPTSLTLQEILGSETEVEREVLESLLKHMKSRSKKEKSINIGLNLKNWLVMKLKRDGFNASLCQTSCFTSLGSPAGDYEYIDIMLEDNENNKKPMRLIVDTDFKSQFELARPTQTYKELTNKLPSIFVGNEEKLNKIISLLCSAAQKSLKERGLHIPPWRTSTYMHSKWLSGCHKVSDTQSGLEETRGGGSHGFINEWAPANPVVKPKRRNFRTGSGLSSQFSNMGINCC